MPSLSTLVVYSIAALLVLIAPGPAVLYVVSQGIRQGSRAAVTAVVGVHAGTLVQVAAAVLGLSWLLLSSSVAFTVVKYAGAAYLIYLGVRALLNRSSGLTEVDAEPRSSQRLLGEGVLVSVLNPKLALFFLAFLPQFVDAERGSPALQITVFGLVFVLLGLCTDGAYALLAGVIGPWLRSRPRVLGGERLVVGGTFIGLGVFTALTPAAHRKP
ncbi:LysE family translocator [Thermomonospora umbrina]|uniref:Threonine/homoserine/homoserine lactone efflux protein n=1 Tax=Thermomonospora umbrina TaxID=111806 RepID=A0A3D9SWT5_9ACTN|nr:LysE family translocator [Thermomonospora umbrina]REE97465.1 threonine/homoserine/homoserine lactone efflux protein [Thermomonospora umbrina]